MFNFILLEFGSNGLSFDDREMPISIICNRTTCCPIWKYLDEKLPGAQPKLDEAIGPVQFILIVSHYPAQTLMSSSEKPTIIVRITKHLQFSQSIVFTNKT